ncbi:MAG TPA: shikimate dehydrogenase [Micavibrio sp.]|jgi:shikimate dehydrogenase
MTMRAGVIGHPIHHSLSPLIHGLWIERHGLDAAYDAIDVAPENLAEKIGGLIERGYAGFNVTLPHKQAVMDLCVDLDPAARAIGAVNMATVRGGKLHGRNTDAYGFIENLKQLYPGFDGAAGPALVLGAGGAARAAIYALLAEQVPEIILCNRTASRAEALAQEGFCQGKARVSEWADRAAAAGKAALIVNATSLGMAGQKALDMDLSRARQDCLVYDIVYRPLMTGLLRQARDRNMPFVTGSGMLLHQARPAFESWFGVLPEVDETLRQAVEGAART